MSTFYDDADMPSTLLVAGEANSVDMDQDQTPTSTSALTHSPTKGPVRLDEMDFEYDGASKPSWASSFSPSPPQAPQQRVALQVEALMPTPQSPYVAGAGIPLQAPDAIAHTNPLMLYSQARCVMAQSDPLMPHPQLAQSNPSTPLSHSSQFQVEMPTHRPLLKRPQTPSPPVPSPTYGPPEPNLGTNLPSLAPPAPITSESHGYLFKDAAKKRDVPLAKHVAVPGPSRAEVEYTRDVLEDSRSRLRQTHRQGKLTENKLRYEMSMLQTDRNVLSDRVASLTAELNSLKQNDADAASKAELLQQHEKTADHYQAECASLQQSLHEANHTKIQLLAEQEKMLQTEYSAILEQKLKEAHEATEKRLTAANLHQQTEIIAAFEERLAKSNQDADTRLERERAQLQEEYKQNLARKDNEIMTLRQNQYQHHSTTTSQAAPSLRQRRGELLTGASATLRVIPYRLPQRAATPEPSNNESLGQASPMAEVPPQRLPTFPVPGPNSPEFDAIVTTAVKETLRSMHINSVQVSKTPSSKRPSKKCQCPESGLTVEQQKLWKDHIRQFWRAKYSFKTYEGFANYIPVPEAQALACNEGRAVPDNTDQLDFSALNSLWNLHLAEQFSEELLAQSVEETWDTGTPSTPWLCQSFLNVIKRSREKWLQAQPRILNQPGQAHPRQETEDEAAVRAQSTNDVYRLRAGSRRRRQVKYDRRYSTVENVITLKTDDDAPDLESWNHLLKLLELLTVDGMSSEEESTTTLAGVTLSVFKVKICPWRTVQIKTYLDLIDASSTNRLVKERGSQIVPRIPSAEVSISVMPGLPRSMYDPAWLEQVERDRPIYFERELQVSEQVFDLLVLVTNGLDLSV